MSAALEKAIKHRAEASRNVGAILKRDYPLEAKVGWSRNGYHQGVVVHHDGHGRIKVKSDRSGKEYWIGCEYIVW